MPDQAAVTHIDDIEGVRQNDEIDAEWKPVRRHFDVRSLGVNAYVAHEPGVLSEVHTETEDSGTRHEELFYVAAGRAEFEVAGERIDAPAGTFVHVRDPAAARGAVAREAGTVLLVMGGEPGVPYTVSPWERAHFAG
jgi:hypothetical protein